MNFHEYNFCLVFCFQCVYSVLVVTIFLVLSWFLRAILQNLRNMLLFQYLVSFLEGDFLPRKTMYAGKSISIGTLKKKKGIDIYNLCAYQDFENFDYCILILQKQWTGPFCVSPFSTCFWYTFTIESSNFNRNHITFIIDTPWLSDSCITSISWSLFLFKLKFLLSHILETLYSYEVVERCETTKVNLFCRGQEE